MRYAHSIRSILGLLSLALLAPSILLAQAEPVDYFMACDPDSMDYIYANWTLDYYVPCTITIDGQIWPDCRVRIRGDSSRSLPKKSLKVKSDGQLFPNGNDVINFNADWYDRSYMRVVMAARLFNEIGVPCFDAEHGRLHLNGSFWGLYVLVQNVDEVFLAENGLDTQGNLYKATMDGASLTVYEDIYAKWEKKSNLLEPWDDLQSLIDSLTAVPDERFGSWAATNLDMDELATIFAANALLANGSTYYHNYYMYHDLNGSGKWAMFPWDVDKTFAQYGASYPYHRSSTDWLHDNPLVERFFITDSLFSQFSASVDNLIHSQFSSAFFFPIMDSLQAAIQSSVLADETDNVPNIDTWYWYINNEKTVGIQGRILDLKSQLDQNPRSLRLDPVPAFAFQDSVPLSWHAAADPNGDSVSYTLRYSIYPDFSEENTTTIAGIADTLFTISPPPPDGNYYLRLFSSDGIPEHEVMGFDSYNKFRIDQGSVLPAVISENTALTNSGSPYFINEDLLVMPGITLTVQFGVELRLAAGVKVTVQGVLNTQGTEANPVRIMRNMFQEERWNALCFDAGSGSSSLRYTVIEGASSGGGFLWEKAAVSSYRTDLNLEYLTFDDCQQCVYVQEADLVLKDSAFFDSNLSEILNVRMGTASVERCVFHNAGAAGDALDFDVVNPGLIRNCIFNGYPGSDDLVDLGEGSLNIILEGNVITGAPDKGVSVGEKSEATLLRNIITNCEIGVAVKDSSLCFLDRNTFHENAIGLSVYEKNPGAGGGFAEAVNSIFSTSLSAPVSVDAYSELDLSFSISDTDTLPGAMNLWGDPMMRDPAAGEFSLQWGSPCIDAGDPSSPLDNDLTPADLGAIFFDQRPLSIVINEINYNSSFNFDPGDWVELHNPGDSQVDLGGYKFKDVGHVFVFPVGMRIASHGYLVLAENLAVFEAVFPGVSSAVGELGFGFSGSGEMLLFTGPDDSIYDWVNYSDQPPWPLEPDGLGPTLELIDPLSNNSLPESWLASLWHGTPGAINSATDPTGIASEATPVFTSLARPFPNPFNPMCTLRFSLAKEGHLKLSVYDLRGRLVADLADGRFKAGNHEVRWMGRDDGGRELSSGIYLLRLKTETGEDSQKLVLLR